MDDERVQFLQSILIASSGLLPSGAGPTCAPQERGVTGEKRTLLGAAGIATGSKNATRGS